MEQKYRMAAKFNFKICQHVIPIMTKQDGSIVNMGSVYGVTAPDFKIYEGTNITI